MSETEQSRTRLGVAYAIAAFGAWGLNPLYFKAITGTPAIEIVGHRVVWSLPLLALMILHAGQWRQVWFALTTRRTLAMLVASSLIVGGNWLLFIHAVVTNRVLESSLGYFINPLVNVLLGRVFLGERLTPLQGLAVALASAGVVNLAIAYGQVPWLALSLAGSFAIYGLIRKTVAVESLPGLFVETLLLSPVALVLLVEFGGSFGRIDRTTDLLLILAGPVTALPLLWFTNAARRLKLALLGFVQFLVPSGQFLLAVFVFGEHFGPTHYVTFGCIWTAIAIFILARGARASKATSQT
ncbi:MAG: chloramphenicol-sensitive protein RarD [Rhodospirillaceae bacterium]|jgi:chloramphenicol-sensitive protein RarD|nr:chloramphenicol-sensitive protein RarD [Rhodospirillaceae bacterium]